MYCKPYTLYEVKMGRPLKKPEDRRREATLRLDPHHRVILKDAAQTAGRSFTGELEARLVATCDLDGKGVELVQAIASEIARIQRMTGKSWHKDLSTWAAVAEMFRIGPIHDFDPDQPHNDEVIQGIFDKMDALEANRSQLIGQLADLGIGARQNPDKPTGDAAGLAQLPDPTRSAARTMCQKIDDPQERERALDILEAILHADDEIRRAEVDFKAQTSVWFKEVKKGRQLFRDHLRREAERKRSLGETFNILHLLEIDP